MSPYDHQVLTLLDTATSLIPELTKSTKDPIRTVLVEKDDSRVLGWREREDERPMDRLLTDGEEMIVDFGGHQVGTISFDLNGIGIGNQLPDSPARIKLTFGEILNDVAESFEPFEGFLSKSWLPEIELTVDFLPQRVVVPRRWAFRFVKIQVLAVSVNYKAQFTSIKAHTLTSASSTDPPPLSFGGKWADKLSDKEKTLLQEIDRVSLTTLRDCCQTVFEDGPKRDMRLWIGDLRLQALTSYSTFKDYKLAKRCLYLIAAMPFPSGKLPAGVFEKPRPCRAGDYIVDYGLLYCSSLLEYVEASGDFQAGHDLYASALAQFAFALAYLNEDNVIACPVLEDKGFKGLDPENWHFIDWQEGLEKSCSEHACLIYTLRSLAKLETILSLPPSSHTLPHYPDQSPVKTEDMIEKLLVSGRKAFWDEEKGTYISGREKQISWASSAWAVLAGLPESREKGAKALRTAYEDKTAIIALTPYLHHYLVDAMVEAGGLEDLAVEHILSYWGSMIEAGGESFFETWDPSRPRHSPYNSFALLSFCHAWSCTPSLLLRKMQMA